MKRGDPWLVFAVCCFVAAVLLFGVTVQTAHGHLLWVSIGFLFLGLVVPRVAMLRHPRARRAALLQATSIDGRPASATHVTETILGDEQPRAIRLAVFCEEPPRLGIGRHSLATRLARASGYRGGETGTPELDELVVLDERPGVLAREALAARASLRDAVVALFAIHGALRLDAAGAEVSALLPPDLPASRQQEALRLLARIASSLERREIEVHALGRRKALSEGGALRCAYCHAGIEGHEPDLVACETCATVLHEGCWAELGRCPVLGCTGAHPERARTS